MKFLKSDKRKFIFHSLTTGEFYKVENETLILCNFYSIYNNFCAEEKI